MAIERQSIIFGGVNSADFGIYIGGEGTFNAPKRAVELISVPGRNGAIQLDKGYYENITVTYPAFCYEPDLDSFAARLRGFRNAISSLKGYQRLTDTIHPDEYRQAMYVDGLEIKPINYNTAATFDLTFNCKPQRFLMSGEAGVSMSSGGQMLNPTPFDASPLLAVDGHGSIDFNGYRLNIDNATMGDITISLPQTWNNVDSVDLSFANRSGDFNVGDTITISGLSVSSTVKISGSGNQVETSELEFIYQSTSADTDATLNYDVIRTGNVPTGVTYTITIPDITLTVGQDKSVSYETKARIYVTYNNGGSWRYLNYYSEERIDYIDGVLTAKLYAPMAAASVANYLSMVSPVTTSIYTLAGIEGVSSLSILGNPTYIDCDLGEAYLINNGTYVSLNQYISLGSDLPKLSPGNNSITFDNTITGFTVTPRWWIL